MSPTVWVTPQGWTVRLDDDGLAWRWDEKRETWVRYVKYDLPDKE